MMELAFLLSFAAGRSDEAAIIFLLLIFNVIVSFYFEYRAGNALRALQQKLSLSVKVQRNGIWTRLDSTRLVPGDLILVQKGNVVPADARILTASDLSCDESLLTGESFPRDKKVGDLVYSASLVRRGDAECEITATGKRTYFGKTIELIAASGKESLIEKDVIRVTQFLMLAGIASILVLSTVLLRAGNAFLDVLVLDISIAIASFPIAYPTVLAIVTAFGVYDLSKKGVIVRRLASIEDLSATDLLLTDKTGTITQNNIILERVVTLTPTAPNPLALAYACSDETLDDPLDVAVVRKAKLDGIPRDFDVLAFTPGGSETKHAFAHVRWKGEELDVVKGATHVVAALCRLDAPAIQDLNTRVEAAATNGYRTLAVAYKKNKNEPFTLAGLLLLTDPPRPDARGAIAFLRSSGITTKMLTGDNSYAAREIAKEVGIGNRAFTRETGGVIETTLLESYDSFAELLPEDKHALVRAAKAHHVVAVTGDGVNDIPALREANVGVAVSTATDATRTSADVVLLEPGISVLKDALVESKKLFEKIYYYSVYRVSESFRVILTILIVGLLLGSFPLLPVQLILLAVMNDIPIIAIAFDDVQIPDKPARVDFVKRTTLSVTLGLTGLVNSLLFLWIALSLLHLSPVQITTGFFLKLSIGGHFLLLVARTKDEWFKHLPTKSLAAALVGTQILAALFALTGTFMPALPLSVIIFLWVYTFVWMQVSDLVKLWARKWLRDDSRA